MKPRTVGRLAAFVFILGMIVLPLVTRAKADGSVDLGMLAYVSEGDLWVRDLPEGLPRQLTTDGGHSRPSWSPSGKWIALRDGDGHVEVMRDTGEKATVIADSNATGTFAWSPVTDTLALTTPNGNLSIAAAPDWNVRPVATVQEQEGMVFPMAWSPDGEWIAFAVWRALPFTEGGDKYPASAALEKVRPDGSDRTELLDAGNPADHGLQLTGWSRDGSDLYYYPDPAFSASLLADGSELWAVKADGSGATRRLAPSVLLVSDFWDEAPDGRTLAVAEGVGRETWLHKRIARVDRESAQLTYLTDTDTAAFSPAWSPDGTQIAYVGARDVGSVGGGPPAQAAAAERRIWLMNSDGSGKRRLTDDKAYRDEFPQWSRDGQYLLFARLDADNVESVWLVPAGGGMPEQVARELGQGTNSEWFGYYGYINWAEHFDWWKGK